MPYHEFPALVAVGYSPLLIALEYATPGAGTTHCSLSNLYNLCISKCVKWCVKPIPVTEACVVGLPLQEEYIKEEQRSLKRELLRAQEEVKRIQSVPLVIGQFLEMVDTNSGIVGSTTGSNYYVRILSTLNRELLKPSASIALHRHSNALVDILPPEADSSISLLTQSERPDVTYQVGRPQAAP